MRRWSHVAAQKGGRAVSERSAHIPFQSWNWVCLKKKRILFYSVNINCCDGTLALVKRKISLSSINLRIVILIFHSLWINKQMTKTKRWKKKAPCSIKTNCGFGAEHRPPPLLAPWGYNECQRPIVYQEIHCQFKSCKPSKTQGINLAMENTLIKSGKERQSETPSMYYSRYSLFHELRWAR